MKALIHCFLFCLLTFGSQAQEMNHSNYQIEGMTMAVTNMPEMLDFYTAVFEIKFEEKDMFGSKLYSGKWGDLKLLFCPAELAQNKAEQNRHQFDIVVTDLDYVLKIAVGRGGKLMGEIQEDEKWRSAGVYDPDNNSILFKALK